jgi:beta-glucosidase
MTHATFPLASSSTVQRNSESSNIPDRAMRELYLKPFAAAVNAGVGSVMCSYNRINETYACENPATLGYLKNDLGFDGEE